MKGIRGRISAAPGNAGLGDVPDPRSVAIGLVEPAYDAVRWANVPGPPTRDLPAVRSLLTANPETHVLALGILVDWIAEGRSLGASEPAEPLFGLLVTPKPPMGPEALAALLERYREAMGGHGWAASQLLKHVARLTRDVFPTYAPDDQARLHEPIAGVLAALAEERWLTPTPSVVAMLRGLLPDVALDPERIPAQRSAKPDARVHLPFGDDPVLSMILSKAFLLARDSAITDPTIVAQIRG
jgi:hypothetical protein